MALGPTLDEPCLRGHSLVFAWKLIRGRLLILIGHVKQELGVFLVFQLKLVVVGSYFRFSSYESMEMMFSGATTIDLQWSLSFSVVALST